MTIVRILIWNLADSKTTVEELRDRLPDAEDGDVWFENAAQERLGLLSTSDELPDLADIRDLIGKEPEIAEEFDAID